MSKKLKSKRYDVPLSRKYSNSIHWHFKEHPKEIGCLAARSWEAGNEFWIVARNYEPNWVRNKANEMQQVLISTL